MQTASVKKARRAARAQRRIEAKKAPAHVPMRDPYTIKCYTRPPHPKPNVHCDRAFGSELRAAPADRSQRFLGCRARAHFDSSEKIAGIPLELARMSISFSIGSDDEDLSDIRESYFENIEEILSTSPQQIAEIEEAREDSEGRVDEVSDYLREHDLLDSYHYDEVDHCYTGPVEMRSWRAPGQKSRILCKTEVTGRLSHGRRYRVGVEARYKTHKANPLFDLKSIVAKCLAKRAAAVAA